MKLKILHLNVFKFSRRPIKLETVLSLVSFAHHHISLLMNHYSKENYGDVQMKLITLIKNCIVVDESKVEIIESRNQFFVLQKHFWLENMNYDFKPPIVAEW